LFLGTIKTFFHYNISVRSPLILHASNVVKFSKFNLCSHVLLANSGISFVALLCTPQVNPCANEVSTPNRCKTLSLLKELIDLFLISDKLFAKITATPRSLPHFLVQKFAVKANFNLQASISHVHHITHAYIKQHKPLYWAMNQDIVIMLQITNPPTNFCVIGKF
jgi:hypothetical protein